MLIDLFLFLLFGVGLAVMRDYLPTRQAIEIALAFGAVVLLVRRDFQKRRRKHE